MSALATVIIVAMVLLVSCYLVPLYARQLSRQGDEEDARHWATSHQPWKLREPWEVKGQRGPREEGPHGPKP